MKIGNLKNGMFEKIKSKNNINKLNKCKKTHLRSNVFLRKNPMSYLDRQNGKKQKMTNENPKSQKLKK